MRPSFACVAAATLLAGASARADAPDVRDSVTGHPGVTYLDLLLQVIPSLANNPEDGQIEGHLAGPLPHIAGKDSGGPPPDPVAASYLEDVRITVGGHRRIVLLADLGQSSESAQDTALLALYDDAPKPRLLDAKDVGVDKDTSFNDPSRLTLGPGDDALITYSEHSNSNQGYAARLLIFAGGDKLQLIADVFTLSDDGCGWKRKETPVFSTHPDGAYRRIDVVIKETLERTDETCGADRVPKPYARAWRGSWRWDSASGQFNGQTRELDRLDKLNNARF